MYKTASNETKEKLRDSHLGNPSFMKGKKFPPSFGRKISEIQTGRKQNAALVEKRITKLRKSIKVSDGRTFLSARHASEFYGIPRSAIIRVARERETTRGLRFEYA